MNQKLNILICPLEWGLGHAARMIPVAAHLRQMDHNVIIAAGEEHLNLFREELPDLATINFPGFKPGYSGYLPQYIVLLFKIPVLLIHIAREHSKLKRIIREHSVDVVISDNRFGLWNRNIRTVYITHMPRIPFPQPFRFLEFTGVILHRAIIRKYTFCFIPDLPGEINFSGRLSHNVRLPENVRFIGILSRFTAAGKTPDTDPSVFEHNTVILSGPEPQKSIFKEKVLNFLEDEKIITLLLEAKPGRGNEIVRSGNFDFCSHLPSGEMQKMIATSRKIISRAGYSSIMELASLNKNALIVPTPGQTEQEYLASYLSAKGWFSTCTQGKLKKGFDPVPAGSSFPPQLTAMSNVLLDAALKELLQYHHRE